MGNMGKWKMIKNAQNFATLTNFFLKVSQLSPKTFDLRKMDSNFLGANLEYLRLLIVSDDKN